MWPMLQFVLNMVVFVVVLCYSGGEMHILLCRLRMLLCVRLVEVWVCLLCRD